MAYRQVWRGLGLAVWLAVGGCAGDDLSSDGGGAGGAGGAGGGSGTGGSAGTSACPAGESECNGLCVDLNTNGANCGKCDHPCEGEVGTFVSCKGGSCQKECQEGFDPCKGGCVAKKSDPQNCGGCGHACLAGEVCEEGACQVGCSSKLTECKGSCVDTQTDLSHCGKCDTPCVAPSGGGTAACAGGQCTLGCSGGKTQCGGACVDLSGDNANCGLCAKTCLTGETCTNSTCTVPACTGGTTKCTSGCVDLKTDSANCGVCGKLCATGQVCTGGKCAQDCGDTTNSPEHCGACDVSCNAPQPAGSGQATCVASACSAGCNAPRLLCAGSPSSETPQKPYYCVQPESGVFCGKGCKTCSGKQCQNGNCQGLSCRIERPEVCDGAIDCFDLLHDSDNCGSCGNVCSMVVDINASCVEGVCMPPGTPVCTGPLKNCAVGKPSAECKNINNDPANCGDCGVKCADGQTCITGHCKEFSVPAEPWECTAIGKSCCRHPLSKRPVCVAVDNTFVCDPCTGPGN